ncbi:hypothetical protein VOLCADRAFT_97061 [Volvox carteri f. nagariensis]|uniref:Uncharacterized protein n=1 Tax=Volvox carteri f. nagariensis TaxID=3068 RepID=D8UBS9_VOLCA|nr:uncharacterized protein VOLCADRAFT_97061 [Volvox carteri f. nagariensis]EFJ42876.1 hypothetical protein VOLCADRAFT_97061 [Volvox carteri f. nagariensis]|eukprot:XP_002956136.1 hypothetical protein VOLCADRAFT_97061 [Volvox carteri f. nagariensis]
MSLRGMFEPNAASDPGAIVALRIGGFWAPRTAVNFCGAAQRTYGDRSDGRAGTVFLVGRAGSLRWIHESQEARLRRRLTPLIEEIAEQLAAAFRTAAGTYQALDIASHQGAVARIPAALRGVIVPFPAQLLKSSRKARDNPFHSTGAGTPVSPQTPRVPGEPPFHQIRNNGHRIAALRDPLMLVHLVDREQGGPLDIASHQGAVARIPAALRGVIVPFPAQLLKSSRKARDNPFHSTGAGTPVSPQTPRVPGEPPSHQIRNNGHRIAALRDPLTLVHLVDREQGGRERRPHRHVPGKLRVIQSRDRV